MDFFIKKSFFSGLNTLKLKKNPFRISAKCLKAGKKILFRGEIARVLNALNREKNPIVGFRPKNFDPKISTPKSPKFLTPKSPLQGSNHSKRSCLATFFFFFLVADSVDDQKNRLVANLLTGLPACLNRKKNPIFGGLPPDP